MWLRPFCLEFRSCGDKAHTWLRRKVTFGFRVESDDYSVEKMPEYIFLQDAYTDNLQQKLKDLHTAWKRCFDKKLAAKAPVWKRKNEGRDSIRFVNFEKYCCLENRRVKLPSGLGWVKFRQSQRVNGKIKMRQSVS